MSSLWELQSFYAPADVIIAGAGFAGLWSAYHLKKSHPRLNIIIIEKDPVLTGASTRNAGFSCFGSVTELMDDTSTSGSDKMQQLVAMRYKGIKMIKDVFTPAEISYKHHGGYELITTKQYTSKQQLMHDIDWLNNKLSCIIPHKNIFQLADKKIMRFGFLQTDHLIENRLEAQLHPGKMVRSLAQKLAAMGVTVHRGIELKSYENVGGKIVIHTNTPGSFTTSQLLIATNALSTGLFPGVNIVPARGQVLVTSRIKDLPFKGTFHYDEGFYYFRNLGNRVLLGGARNMAFEEERTTDLSISDTVQHELERFLKDIVLPGKSYTIDHRWSGIMGMGADKIPTIKELQPNCFCLVGLGGMGVALAPVAGKMAAKMMMS